MRYETKGETLIVYYEGEIDHHRSVDIRNRTDRLIRTYFPQELILDFGGVTFCDSSGIAVVLGRYKLMTMYGGKTTLRSLPETVKRIFDMAGIDGVLSGKKGNKK